MAIQGLRTRFITSVFFVLIMLTGILAGKYTFALLFTLIVLLCLREFLEAGLRGEERSLRVLHQLGIALGAAPFLTITAIQLGWSAPDYFLHMALLFIIALFFIFLLELFRNDPSPFTSIGYIFTGLIYIGIPFGLLALMAFDHESGYNRELILGLVLLTWTNDTGAYLVGSRFGKTPFFPRISPKKTWEGVIGAGILCLLIAIALSFVLPSISLLHWIPLALLVFVFGTLGDLIESMFKRSRQIKDTGSLLPGHGGLLDRFDGFIFHLPFTAAYVLVVMAS